MGIEVGTELKINGSGDWDGKENPKDESKKEIRIGLGFGLNQWSSEAFHLYSRLGVVLIPEDGNAGSKGNIIALDINPSIQIGDVGRLFFDLGFGVALFDEEVGDLGKSPLVWHFNPYLKKSIGIGDLYIGFNIWNNKIAPNWYEGPIQKGSILEEDFINFSLPIYFEVSF